MDHLETARTRLRRLQKSDLKNMIELETDPEIVRFTPSRFPLSQEKIESRLYAQIQKQSAYAPLGIWAAESKDEHDFIGWFMLVETDLQYTELGFMVARRHWGKGFATEIVKCLVDCGLHIFKLPGISARTDSDNKVSIRILEKVGMSLVDRTSSFDRGLNRENETLRYHIESDK